MRAVYLIIWAILTVLVCYFLYEQNDNSNLLSNTETTSQSLAIQAEESSLDSPSVDDNFYEGNDTTQVSKKDSMEASAPSKYVNQSTKSDNLGQASNSDEQEELQVSEGGSSEEDNYTTAAGEDDFLQKAYIEFRQNSMTLPTMEDLEEYMDSLAQVVVSNDLKIVVEGHADKSKSRRYDNFEVAQKRADFVKNALLSRGIPDDRIESISRGDTMPRKDIESLDAKKNNRRVELFIKQNNR